MPGSRIAVVLLLLLTAACAPVMLEFYRPAAAGGQVTRTACPPVHRLILFERLDVTIGIAVNAYSKDHVAGVVTFEVPEGKVVHLLDQEVEVSVASRGAMKGRLSSGHAWTGGAFSQPRDVPPDTPLTGKTTRHWLSWMPAFSTPTLYGHTKHAFYTFSFSVPLAMPEVPEALVMKLPGLSVDNREIELPAITFTRDRERAIVGLNC